MKMYRKEMANWFSVSSCNKPLTYLYKMRDEHEHCLERIFAKKIRWHSNCTLIALLELNACEIFLPEKRTNKTKRSNTHTHTHNM